ncbi:serine hydrolase domain-containing protein [Camelimonas abortus]|uniref:Serine hydrolase domain-containing protein n=1 Tax=Camelimonas abortus TaxID=1017184 RepID=A0ABV7LDA1_9HYPH
MSSLPVIRPEEAGFSAERLARIGAVFREHVERRRLAGAVFLLSRYGKIAHLEAVGARDPVSGDPMRADAVFRCYSMTKPVVSVMAMMLAERGQLLLTDPVSKYIPAYAGVKVGVVRDGRMQLEEPRREITVHDLLRHTSGLSYEFLAAPELQKLYMDAKIFRRNWTSMEHAEALAKLPLNSHPGEQWDYGRSTDVLGAIVEVITGQSLGEALQDNIFGPLGMTDTGFCVRPEALDRLAEPLPVHPLTGAPVKLLDVTKPYPFESGGGGLVSTAMDYARFIQMLQNGGALGPARLLSRKTVAFMTADHLPPGARVGSDLLPPGHGFGLGFAVRAAPGLSPTPGSVGQYFWSGIAGTTFWVDPQEEFFALLMIQVPPELREEYRLLFRNLAYAAFAD